MRRNLGQMVVIGLISSVIGIAVALSIHWFPTAASTQAQPIDTLFDVLLIVSVPVFVLVEVVVLFSVWKFRMRPGQEMEDGPPIHGNTKLEIVWTAIPAILLVSLCTYAYVVLTDIEKAQAAEMRIVVTGQQFAWSYAYPQPGGKEIVSDELYLPINKPVLFQVRSKDVIHDFFVPAFRMKIDAVPGITTEIRVTPSKLGLYPVVCAELCGLGHGAMRSTAHVLQPSAFQAWLKGKGRGAKAAPGPGEQRGAGGAVGPEPSDRSTLAPGQGLHYIRRSILNPDPDAEMKGYPASVMLKTRGQQLSRRRSRRVSPLDQVTK